MISVVPSKPDWFYIDEPSWRPISGLPGADVKLRDRRIVHRSMLPLIETDEVERLRYELSGDLDQVSSTRAARWKLRDEQATELGFKYRTTQHQAIDYIEPRRGTLLGDDMRLGKTLSALGAHDPDRGQLVIVAPLSARGVWLGWAKRAFPYLEIGIAIGKKFKLDVFDKPIVFMHYDIVGHWQSTKPIGTLVLDEAHALTNRKTKRTNAVVLLASRAEKVIALTGTPIWNMPPDLWAVIGLVAPGAWGSYYDFSGRYGAPMSTGYGVVYTGASNQDELNARMQEVMLRRLWKDCAQDLPPISRSVVVAEVNDAEKRKLDVLAGALKAEHSKQNTASNLAAYRRQVTAFKIKTAVREAQKILDRGEPVVLWTWHRDAAEELHKQLGGMLMHGEIAPDKREQIMADWKASTVPRAFVATLAVGQVAIDLSHARIAIFVEIDYTPAVLGQAEMRTFPSNNLARGMDVMFIVADHIVDQRIIRALINKLGAADSLGVGAANDAIDALRDAIMGPRDDGSLDRLLEDFLEAA